MLTYVSVDGRYLNLPVMNELGEIVGMVDVLKLTYATLEQVRSSSLEIEIHYADYCAGEHYAVK